MKKIISKLFKLPLYVIIIDAIIFIRLVVLLVFYFLKNKLMLWLKIKKKMGNKILSEKQLHK